MSPESQSPDASAYAGPISAEHSSPAGCEPQPPILILGRAGVTPTLRNPSMDRDRVTIMSWDEVTVLVERAQRGERTAYGELVKRFENAVFAIALTKVRDAVEAQELTQEV